jgi:hypothetical protein
VHQRVHLPLRQLHAQQGSVKCGVNPTSSESIRILELMYIM